LNFHFYGKKQNIFMPTINGDTSYVLELITIKKMKQSVHIEKLVFGGLGLARTKDGVLFVRDVLPGEKVEAVIDGTIGGQKYAQPLAILEPSAHRRAPPCEYFGTCGGCDWLFCDYKAQLSIKRDIFLECLIRIGKVTMLPNCEIFHSPEFGYRRRVQFKISKTPDAIGFFKRKSHDVVALRRCPLLQPALNSLLGNSVELLKLLPFDVREIKCIEGGDTNVASAPVLSGYTSDLVEIHIGKHSFKVSGDQFFQSNAFLCESLEAWGNEGMRSGDYFVDLYGGVGLLAVLWSERFRKGTIVDTIESQTDAAEKNLADNGISHINARCVSAEDFLSECSRSDARIDCLILDPPRSGLTNRVREGIADCLPSKILYISCNPSTQARDIGFFARRAGYAIEKMALFDFYPNTHHLETAVMLKR
jgi:23S rRNA (uracil1939-C5)-methyltransferase